MSTKSEAKTKNHGVAGWKVGQTWHRNNCSHEKKYSKNIETLPAKQLFFPPYLRQAAKIYVATSHSVVRQETVEISEQRTVFVCSFAQEVDWCMKDCDKQRLQTTVSINLWKILAGHTGDWFDVKTASICTTELWAALKSFIVTSLKFSVAPYPIIVSLDTLNQDWHELQWAQCNQTDPPVSAQHTAGLRGVKCRWPRPGNSRSWQKFAHNLRSDFRPKSGPAYYRGCFSFRAKWNQKFECW